MITNVSEGTLIPLKGGAVIHARVAVWLIDASFGRDFRIEGGDVLVSPRSAVTDDVRQFIRDHRAEVIAAIRYVNDLPLC